MTKPDDEADIPLVVGTPVDEAQEMRVTILHCSDCGSQYALPEEVDNEKLLRVCPDCATRSTVKRAGG